jgi:hypothetical protein
MLYADIPLQRPFAATRLTLGLKANEVLRNATIDVRL